MMPKNNDLGTKIIHVVLICILIRCISFTFGYFLVTAAFIYCPNTKH